MNSVGRSLSVCSTLSGLFSNLQSQGQILHPACLFSENIA